MALSTINSRIGEARDSAGAKAEAIRNGVVSGNTTMAHLLLTIEPRYLRRDPYIRLSAGSPEDLQQHDLRRFFQQSKVDGRIHLGPVPAPHGSECFSQCNRSGTFGNLSYYSKYVPA